MAQRTVIPPQSVEADGNTEKQEETRLLLFEYVGQRAEGDAEIPVSDLNQIRELQQQVTGPGVNETAQQMGRTLAVRGML